MNNVITLKTNAHWATNTIYQNFTNNSNSSKRIWMDLKWMLFLVLP